MVICRLNPRLVADKILLLFRQIAQAKMIVMFVIRHDFRAPACVHVEQHHDEDRQDRRGDRGHRDEAVRPPANAGQDVGKSKFHANHLFKSKVYL